MKSLSCVVAVAISVWISPCEGVDAQDTPPPSRSPTATTPASGPRGLLKEPSFIRQGFEIADGFAPSGDPRDLKNGFYPELGEMITGAGWISVGPGYRHRVFGTHGLVDVSGAISWRAYKMAQARFELPRVANGRIVVGTQVRWHDYTQVSYWGEGPDTQDANRSDYRIRAINSVGYGSVRPVPWLSFNGRFGWLSRPEILPPQSVFGRANPPTSEVFPEDPVYQFSEQPDFIYGDVSVVAETRDHRGYATRGGLYRGAWLRFSDRERDSFSFARYEAEALHYIPIAENNVVFVLHGLIVGTRSGAEQHVPFYLAPSLGGGTTMRGYSHYRFHDRNAAVINAETRVAVFEHIDAALFVDVGNVAARFHGLNLKKTSYGFGIRIHSATANFAVFDLGHGSEGWNFGFRVADPFRFSRVTTRTAPIPFAP